MSRSTQARVVWVISVMLLAACAAAASQTSEQGSVTISDPTGGLATQLGPYGLLGAMGYKGMGQMDKFLGLLDRMLAVVERWTSDGASFPVIPPINIVHDFRERDDDTQQDQARGFLARDKS